MSYSVEFQQGKNRDGRPTWLAYIGDVHVGRVKWWAAHESFAFTPQPGVPLRAWALDDIANFLKRMDREAGS